MATAASSLSTPISDLFPEALEGAVALIHADGGELALLDVARQVMVVRARSGGTARASPRRLRHAEPPISAIRPRRRPGPRSIDPEIEEQSTVLLPAIARTYSSRLGEGLIGQAWQRGEAVVMRAEDYRATAGPSRRPATARGIWPCRFSGQGRCIACARAPRSSASWRSTTTIPVGTYSARDIESLQLHADRVGRALHEAELARQHYSQSELLDLLRGAGGQLPQPQAAVVRIRDLVRQVVDAPSFALALFHPTHERDHLRGGGAR